MIQANSAYPVYVYNSFKKLLVIFPSVNTLAKLLKSNHLTLVEYLQEGKLFRGAAKPDIFVEFLSILVINL